ncbi:MAG: hypothetical protein ABDH32_05315 [Candidatus Caldarchaeales archaeon]
MAEGKIYYVDVANSLDSKKNKSKMHVVFDGERCFKVKKLTELRDAEEIYIDVLFSSIYSEIYELLKNGVKIFLLKNTRVLKEKRVENNLKKSDENDALTISKIPKEFFREVMMWEIEVKIEMNPLISRYERLGKRIQVLKQWLRDTPEYCDIKKVIRDYEKEKRRIGEEICRKINENTPIYRKILQIIGLNDSVELAISLTFIDLSHSKSEIWSYCKHNFRVNKHLSLLASSIYFNLKKGKCKKISEKYRRLIELVKSKKMCRRQIITRIKTQIIKDMRQAYLLSNRPQATTTISVRPTGHEL